VISTLFTQFRHQHANGSLTTELLMHHAEQYLVKATVSIGEQVVATALAADKDLIVADDQAKTRVLALLGFGVASAAQPTIPTESSSETLNQALPSVTEAQALTNGSNLSDASAAAEAAPDIISTSPQSTEPLDTEPTDIEDMGRPIDSFTPDEAPAPSQVPASSLAAPTLENFDDSNPVDLSDIIAQTDVEMSRLGWSSIQGRNYLEKTFNKRSRQQLTDEELLTFLLYLESQATPSMN
jgi:hypothetical protein